MIRHWLKNKYSWRWQVLTGMREGTGALKESWDNGRSGILTAAPQMRKQTLDRWRINPSAILPQEMEVQVHTQVSTRRLRTAPRIFAPKPDTTPVSFNTLNGQAAGTSSGTTPLNDRKERALASQSSDELQRHRKSKHCTTPFTRDSPRFRTLMCKENRRRCTRGQGRGEGHPGDRGQWMVLSLTAVSGKSMKRRNSS